MDIDNILVIIIYVFLIILIITTIVAMIKVIKTLNKVEKVVDDVDHKLEKLNGTFDLVDMATDTIASLSDRIVGFISNGILNLFKKKKGDKDE